MKIILQVMLFSTTLILYGCSDPQLYNYNGNYYMVGDSDCKLFRESTPTSILCFKSENSPTGVRRALTNQEVYEVNQRLAQEAEYYRQNNAALKQSVQNQTNQYIQNVRPNLPNSGTINTQNNSYSAPSTNSQAGGTPVYTAGECKGTVANNRCIGIIIPNPGYQKRCYGPIINGECKGPYY